MEEERPGIVERAFQIAKSGVVADLSGLRQALSAEGYANSAQFLSGRSIANQLTRMISEARQNGAPPPSET